jgi:predicted nucleic acid-binding protein
MSVYLLDTNIVLTYLRKAQESIQLEQKLLLLRPENTLIVSVVSVGEMRSIAMQNAWGEQRLTRLEDFFLRLMIAEINVDSVIKRYAEIDAYSQGRHPAIKGAFSPRNMGKNDLWIAATASILGVELITMDRDFDHLDTIFIQLKKVKLKE